MSENTALVLKYRVSGIISHLRANHSGIKVEMASADTVRVTGKNLDTVQEDILKNFTPQYTVKKVGDGLDVTRDYSVSIYGATATASNGTRTIDVNTRFRIASGQYGWNDMRLIKGEDKIWTLYDGNKKRVQSSLVLNALWTLCEEKFRK